MPNRIAKTSVLAAAALFAAAMLPAATAQEESSLISLLVTEAGPSYKTPDGWSCSTDFNRVEAPSDAFTFTTSATCQPDVHLPKCSTVSVAAAATGIVVGGVVGACTPTPIAACFVASPLQTSCTASSTGVGIAPVRCVAQGVGVGSAFTFWANCWYS